MKISIVQHEKPFLKLHQKLVSKHEKQIDAAFRRRLEIKMSQGQIVRGEHFSVLKSMIEDYRWIDYEET